MEIPENFSCSGRPHENQCRKKNSGQESYWRRHWHRDNHHLVSWKSRTHRAKYPSDPHAHRPYVRIPKFYSHLLARVSSSLRVSLAPLFYRLGFGDAAEKLPSGRRRVGRYRCLATQPPHFTTREPTPSSATPSRMIQLCDMFHF